MRIIVIGGTQFIGRAIVERLVRRGDEVAVVHRGDRHGFGPSVRNLQADRSDLPALAAVLRRERPDVVFDLAYDWQRGTPAEQIEAAARSCGPELQRYVFMSSIAAYGPGLNHRESDDLAGSASPNPYAAHKADAERRLFAMRAASGFPVVTFRPPFVHGPNQPFYREQFFWDRLRDGRPIILPDDGSAPTQWVFVSDVADACVRAMEVPQAAGEAFNVAHLEPMTQREFVEALAHVAGATATFVPVPRARIAAAGGQLMGDRIYFGEVLDLPPHTEVVEKVTRVLGVTPTPFETALRAGFAWYTAQPRRTVDYSFEDTVIAAS